MNTEKLSSESQPSNGILGAVRRICNNCKYLMIKQPTFDQPYTECWCDRGCFDACGGGNELEEETNCTFFNYA